ncbi:unnamed protein product [Haemonchus placei]|uniref:Protein kinase domain-containing protein n=1 Tax=Haemonchus placei TaxID=6290 RepID=A0A0N4WV76_HAEPC|nr:unnamed protein product [Haemonchus placei]
MKLGMWTILLLSFVTHGAWASAQYPYAAALGDTDLTDYEANEGSGEEETPYFLIPWQSFSNIQLGMECSTKTSTKSEATSFFCIVAQCPCTPEFCLETFPKAPSSSILGSALPCPNNPKSTTPPNKRSITTIKKTPPKENANRTASRSRKLRKSVTRMSEKRGDAAPLQPPHLGLPFIHYNFFTRRVTPLIVHQNIAPSTAPTTAYEPLQSPKDKAIGRTSTTRKSLGVVSRKRQSNSFKKKPSNTTPPKKTITLATILLGHIQTLKNPSKSPSKSKSERSVRESSPFHGSAARGERTKRDAGLSISRRSQLRILTSKQTSTALPLTARPASSEHGKKWASGQHQVTTRMMPKDVDGPSAMPNRTWNESLPFQAFSLATMTAKMQRHNSTSRIYSSNTTKPGVSIATDAHNTTVPSADSDASVGLTSQKTSTSSESQWKSSSSLSSQSRRIDPGSPSSLNPIAVQSIYFRTTAKYRLPSGQLTMPENPPPIGSRTSLNASTDTTRLITSPATTPLSSLISRAGTTKKSTPTDAAKSTATSTAVRKNHETTATASLSSPSTLKSFKSRSETTKAEKSTTSTGATLLTTSASATPQSASTYGSSTTSKPTSVGANESTTTDEPAALTSTSPTRAVMSSTNSPNVTEAKQYTTSTRADEYPTSTIPTSTRIVPSRTMPAQSTEAEQPATNTDSGTVIKTIVTMPQTATVYSTMVPLKTTVLERDRTTTREELTNCFFGLSYVKRKLTVDRLASVIESSTATPDALFPHGVSIIKENTTSSSSQHTTPSPGVLTEAEHSAASGAYTTMPITSSETMPQSSSISGDLTTGKSATLAESTTTSTVTTLPITSLRTEHETTRIQETSATNKHTASEEANSTTTSTVAGEHHVYCHYCDNSTVTSSPASSHSSKTPNTSSELTKAGQSTTSIVATLQTRSSASMHQSSNTYEATETSKPTPQGAVESITTSKHHTGTVTSSHPSTHSSESSKYATELTEAEQFTTSTDAAVAVTSPRITEHLSSVHGTSSEGMSTTLETAEKTSSKKGSTDLKTSSVTVQQSSSIHSGSVTNKSTTLQRTKSVTTSERLTSTGFNPASSRSSKKPSESTEAASSTTRDRTTVVTRSKTVPLTISIYDAIVTNKSTPLETTERATTSTVAQKHYTTIGTPSIPSSRSTLSSKNTSELIETEQPATSS